MIQRRRQHQQQPVTSSSSSNDSEKHTSYNSNNNTIMNTTTTPTITSTGNYTNLNFGNTGGSSGNYNSTSINNATATGTSNDNNNNNKISSESYYSEYHGHKVQHLTKILQEFESQQQQIQQQSSSTRTGIENTTTTTNSRKTTGSTSTSTNTSTNTIRNYSKNNRIIWTAGDSSLDNKYWFTNTVPALQNTIYDKVLVPSIMKPDITYWMNYYLLNEQNEQQTDANNSNTSNNSIVINTAVEATTINERTFRLREQDVFIQNNLSSNDILIVSIGGNDIALAPTPCTIISILSLIYCIPTYIIQNPIVFTWCYNNNNNNNNNKCNPCCCISILQNDDYCYGCCTSTISCCTMFPFCLGYFKHLLGTRIQHYITKILITTTTTTNTNNTNSSKMTIPDQILICTIYYPDTNQHVPSWANTALSLLQYNNNPNKLQLLINTIYQLVTSDIRLSINTNTTSNTTGSTTTNNNRPTIVTAVPLFAILDGTNTNDYIHRVEPSIQGSQKLAHYLINIINNNDSQRITNNNIIQLQQQQSQQGQQRQSQHFYYNNCNNISLEVPQSNSMTDR